MLVDIVLEGDRPLLIHSQRAMNYRDPLARELQDLNSRRGKTIEDRVRISDLEMELGLYWEEDLGPFMPLINLKRCIQDGGKHFKLGTHVQQALRSLAGQDKAPILYEGPRDIKELVEDSRFRDVRTVGIAGRTVERTRPIFHQWKIGARFVLDEDRLDLHKLKSCIDRAGSYIALGDYRPEYGTFAASLKEVKLDASNTGFGLAQTV